MSPPLVDYSSEDDDDKVSITATTAAPSLPPLPSAFHDLYASTVRTSTRDDPALHQGRTRRIPHVAGNWPSHIYVEWFPSQAESDTLASLLSALRDDLSLIPGGVDLHSFLTSDLAAPLPLHISLSRPFVLTTAEKDDFLDRVTAAVPPHAPKFTVRPTALSWHISPDSNRAFLVLRVQDGDGRNSGLGKLLSRCNALVTEFGQPPLYSNGQSQGDEAATADKFHVSIAWSFAQVTEELQSRTIGVFSGEMATQRFKSRIAAITVPIDAVKVKIGNVITSLPLK